MSKKITKMTEYDVLAEEIIVFANTLNEYWFPNQPDFTIAYGYIPETLKESARVFGILHQDTGTPSYNLCLGVANHAATTGTIIALEWLYDKAVLVAGKIR